MFRTIPSANSPAAESRTLTKSINSPHPAQMKRFAKLQLPKWRQRVTINQRQLTSISIYALEINSRSLTNDEVSTMVSLTRNARKLPSDKSRSATVGERKTASRTSLAIRVPFTMNAKSSPPKRVRSRWMPFVTTVQTRTEWKQYLVAL
jgi:hypothetical protein